MERKPRSRPLKAAMENPTAGSSPEQTASSRGASGPSEFHWNPRLDFLIVGIVVLLGFLAFANSLGNGFVYDDISFIQENKRLDAGANPAPYFKDTYTGEKTDKHYRPLTLWSWGVERALAGNRPFPVHLTNVVLNCLSAGLIYVFCCLLFGSRPMAVACALVFALHPVHTEVVANGVGRSELGGFLFMMMAAVAHLLSIRAESGPRPGRSMVLLGIACVLYFVAMLFKENPVTIPGLLFLADWLVLRRGSIGDMIARIWRYALYVVPLGVYMAIRLSVVGKGTPMIQEVMEGASKLNLFLYGNETLLRYIGQLILPVNLCAEYSDYLNPVRSSWGDPMVIGAFACWMALGVAVWFLVRRKQFVPVFGICWFFLAILPTSNILFPIGTVRADRLLFQPSLGYAIVVAWLAMVASRHQAMVARGALVLYLAFFGWKTVSRNPVWKSSQTLWTETIRQNPGSAVGWGFVGDFHLEKGETKEAAECYEKAMELRQRLGFFYREANNKLGALYRKTDPAKSLGYYLVSIQKEPNHPVAYINAGEILLTDPSRRDEAIRYMEKAMQLKPEEPAPWLNCAQAWKLNGDLDKAWTYLLGAEKLIPNHPAVRQVKAELEALRKARGTATNGQGTTAP